MGCEKCTLPDNDQLSYENMWVFPYKGMPNEKQSYREHDKWQISARNILILSLLSD